VSWITETMRVPVRSMTYLPLVMQNYTPPCPDAYEPDDASAQARVIAPDGMAQRHTFHQANDADWITFSDRHKHVYVVETFDLSARIRSSTCMIRRRASAGLERRCRSRVRRFHLTFHPYHTGTFYVRVVNYNPRRAAVVSDTRFASPLSHEAMCWSSLATCARLPPRGLTHNRRVV